MSETDLVQQAKAALTSADGGLLVNQWRPVTLVQGDRRVEVEVFCPANTRAGIRLRRSVALASGKYYEVMRFNKRGELVNGPLVEAAR